MAAEEEAVQAAAVVEEAARAAVQAVEAVREAPQAEGPVVLRRPTFPCRSVIVVQVTIAGLHRTISVM